MKVIYLLPVFLLLSLFVSAQNEEDALRFSTLHAYGSARMTAMGGAFGALGGDLSALSLNPGGVGVFRRSEVSFTSTLDFDKVTSGRFDRDRNTYLIGTLGFALSFETGDKKWKSVNFGFNYTTLNNFNRNAMLGGHLSASSLADVWLQEANGTKRDDLNPFTTSLAYDACILLKKENSDDQYMIPFNEGDQVEQRRFMKERGYQGEYAISLGTNYDDKLYLGFTLGVQSIHYRSYANYMEGMPEGEETTSKLSHFNFEQEFETSGMGVNFKVGAIYRPIPLLRLGFSVHTPTFYSLDADAYNHVSAWYFEPPLADDANTAFGNGAAATFAYKLKTPWRMIASVAGVFGQKALLSFDYEYVDYANANFSNDEAGDEYDETNEGIKNGYRATHNFRVGAEYRMNSIFSLRAGYAYWASPYEKGDLNSTHDTQLLSGGFGLNFGNFFVDAAYQHKSMKNNTLFYYYQDATLSAPIESPEVSSECKNNLFKLTLGLRF